eukprot:scaffold1033_cov408-Prasinococcus_capsulatus_cf.AAC.7
MEGANTRELNVARWRDLGKRMAHDDGDGADSSSNAIASSSPALLSSLAMSSNVRGLLDGIGA